MYYAGIGNRYNVPSEVEQLIREIAEHNQLLNIGLRSGGAIGCDTMFQAGASVYSGPSIQIFRPKDVTQAAIFMASQFTTNWEDRPDYHQRLFGRNCQIILGKNLDDPVKFVVCYAASEESGGTAMALRLARANHIRVYNLAKQEDFDYWALEVV